MKINNSIVLKDLAGKEIVIDDKKFTLGQALANISINAKEGGKMKLYTLATKLYSDKDINVDEADLSLLKNVVKTSEVYSALVLGQCEILLEEVK
jgi:hypothetical protein